MFKLSASKFVSLANLASKNCLVANGWHRRIIANGSPMQAMFISHKSRKDPDIERDKPKPWPYKTKKWTRFHQLLHMDYTLKKFDENTKIIVVEGNMCAGKEKFGKQLAEELGMHFIAEPQIDQIYFNEYGFDYRTLNHLLPEECQAYDMKMFYQNPNHMGKVTMQFQMYRLRYWYYLEALAHLFSTGQGVVVERCPWSDFVFVETMYAHNYFDAEARAYYYRVRNHTVHSPILRPHVVIYLDVPVDVIQKRIKERNRPEEVNSKVLTPEYLKSIEHFYKKSYLPEINKHAMMLMYDWSNGGDIDMVVEDLEKMEFDGYCPPSEKMEDWQVFNENEWGQLRYMFCNDQRDILMEIHALPMYDIDSLHMSGQGADFLDLILEEYAPHHGYEYGHDPEVHGFFKVLFNFKRRNYRDFEIGGYFYPYR